MIPSRITPSRTTPCRIAARSCLATFIVATALGTLPAHAQEAQIKKAFEARYPKVRVESVRPLPYGGLYEVVVNAGPILYVDKGFTFLLQGALVDLKTGANVTGDRQKELQALREGPIDFRQLPLELALKKVVGKGERTLVTFEDPNCGFCQKLAVELAKLDNVTIYTFLLPIVAPDSTTRARAIWCSPDRNGAWERWMRSGIQPDAAPASCETPIERTLGLAEKFNVEGTPTMFLANGQRVVGGLPAAQIDQLLDSVK
jgi:thiol:disulfide interchange protein DsbC